MRRILLFAGFAVAVLLVAAALRLRDAPYLAYQRGAVSDALPGLTEKAERGDGFAAYLIGTVHHSSTMEGMTPRSAAGWYLAAARAGEIRAIHSYLKLVLSDPANADACGKAIVLLELTARTGDLGSMTIMSEVHRVGRCGPVDLARAGSYLVAASRVDRRFAGNRDNLLKLLAPDDARAVRPIPHEFDVDPRQALARFVNEAPALLPDNLR